MKAHELICDESRFLKGFFAERADGSYTLGSDATAVRFCLAGALQRCYPTRESNDAAFAKLEAVLGEGDAVAEWNDAPERTFAEVRDLLVKLDI